MDDAVFGFAACKSDVAGVAWGGPRVTGRSRAGYEGPTGALEERWPCWGEHIGQLR